jgi:choline monooxygenase
MTEGSHMLEPGSYHLARRYELEKVEHLSKSWIFFGLVDRLQKPGDTIVESIMGASVLVRRGRDGALRAFHNICRHRAGPLAWEGAQNCDVLRCRYHGWVYTEDGKLAETPGFYGNFKAGRPSGDFSLYPIRVELWRQFIFINFDTEARPLLECMGELPELCAEADLDERLVPHSKKRFIFSCNWKLYVENWLESYHFPWLHESLSSDVMIADYKVRVGERVVVHNAPQGRDQAIYEGVWIWLPFTTCWNFYSDGLSVERVLPINECVTQVDYTFLFNKGTPLETIHSTIEMCDQVTNEDGKVCEASHVNLQQGLFTMGPLSPVHEVAIEFFHSLLSSDRVHRLTSEPDSILSNGKARRSSLFKG